MSLRERLMRESGAAAGSAVVTGAGLYLALARLEALLGGRVEEFNEQLAARSLSALPASLAFVSDFTVEDRATLESELFTASMVGGMVVGLGKSEGVILDDDRGLAVRLHNAVSPALGAMLESFRQCLDRVTLAVIGDGAGRPVSPMMALAE